MVCCACSSNFASTCSVRRSNSFSFEDSRFSHSRRDFLFAGGQFGLLAAQIGFQILHVFETPMQFAEELRQIAFAVAHTTHARDS